MTVFQNNNSYLVQDVNFVGSATSTEIISLSGGSPVAIITPASLGATTFTFTAATSPTGTFYPVNDQTGTAITVTVSTSAAGWADITSIFPASVQYVKVISGTSITKTIQLVSRNV